jgi:uncharacterized membrane-anchored protein YhcB (DUF1043 family)
MRKNMSLTAQIDEIKLALISLIQRLEEHPEQSQEVLEQISKLKPPSDYGIIDDDLSESNREIWRGKMLKTVLYGFGLFNTVFSATNFFKPKTDTTNFINSEGLICSTIVYLAALPYALKFFDQLIEKGKQKQEQLSTFKQTVEHIRQEVGPFYNRAVDLISSTLSKEEFSKSGLKKIALVNTEESHRLSPQ